VDTATSPTISFSTLAMYDDIRGAEGGVDKVSEKSEKSEKSGYDPFQNPVNIYCTADDVPLYQSMDMQPTYISEKL